MARAFSRSAIHLSEVSVGLAVALAGVAGPAMAQSNHSPGQALSDLRANLLLSAYRTSYAIGDFNADGHNDLAIGVPYATVGSRFAAGKVIVIAGDANGLTDRRTVFHQAASGRFHLPGANEAGDLVGFSLAAGDFDGDGDDDLAVGAPGEDGPGDGNFTGVDGGAVFVGLGSANGLDFRNPGTAYTQGGSGRFDLAGVSRFGQLAGYSLAAGDFDGDGYDDIAIGAPGKFRVDGGDVVKDLGAVVIAEGTPSGPDGSAPNQPYSRGEFWEDGAGNFNLPGGSARGDAIGFSLAAADFNADGRDDLAIGSPGQQVDGRANAGVVKVLVGTASGLDARLNPDGFSTAADGAYRLRGTSQANAFLGFALAAGDFDGDGFADLAVGAPGRTVSGSANAGAVVVIRGQRNGQNGELRMTGQWYEAEFTRSAADADYDLHGSARSGDLLGYSLAAGDLDFDLSTPGDDLAIGVPGDDHRPDGGPVQDDSGSVIVKFGSPGRGLASEKASQKLAQNRSGARNNLVGSSEAGDSVGASVAVGRLGDGAAADLVISAPGERVTNTTAGVALEDGYRLMTVDAMTHVVDGEAGIGPNAENEQSFSFSRFSRGAQAAASAINDVVNELVPATAPIVRDDNFYAYSGRSFHLATDDSYFERTGTWYAYGCRRLGIVCQFWPYEFTVHVRLTAVNGGILANASSSYEWFGHGAVASETLRPSPGFGRPALVVHLPNGSVEAILE